jgi:hypothetical protein
MSADQILTLSNQFDTIDLYTWLNQGEGGEGLEALGGILGFGMTGQKNHWSEGAGHGALYRGSRILPREMSIPLRAQARDRGKLNEVLSRMSSMFLPDNGLVRLTYGLPGGETWYCDVIREGGGDFARRSKDSNNRTWYKATVLLKAGDPFWSRNTPGVLVVTQDTSGRGLLPMLAELQLSFTRAFGSITITNPGNVVSPLEWEANGPFTELILTGSNGEVLHWIGEIDAGEGLRIRRGRVLDFTGANRYDGLQPSPKFWGIAPGVSQITVQAEGTSLGALTPIGPTLRTNLAENPSSDTATNSFNDPAFGTESTTREATLGYSGIGFTRMLWSAPSTTTASGVQLSGGARSIGNASLTVLAGDHYSFSAYVRCNRARTLRPVIMHSSSPTVYGPVVNIPANTWVRMAIEETMTANDTAVGLAIYAAAGSPSPTWSAGDTLDIDAVLIEQGPLGSFFDGNSLRSEAGWYDWVGTAGNSQSFSRAAEFQGVSSVIGRWRPQRWAVV